MNEDELPPIEQLSVKQANRLVTADWLRSIAKLIQTGVIDSFECAWNFDLPKPIGRFTASCEMLSAPLEAKLHEAVAVYKKEHLAVIPVVDVTEQLKDHVPCEGDAKENCALCNTSLS